jgi:hypothetical protein
VPALKTRKRKAPAVDLGPPSPPEAASRKRAKRISQAEAPETEQVTATTGRRGRNKVVSGAMSSAYVPGIFESTKRR